MNDMTFNFTLRYAGKLPIVVCVHGAQDGRQARKALRSEYDTAFATIGNNVTPDRHTVEHLHIKEVAVEMTDADRGV